MFIYLNGWTQIWSPSLPNDTLKALWCSRSRIRPLPTIQNISGPAHVTIFGQFLRLNTDVEFLSRSPSFKQLLYRIGNENITKHNFTYVKAIGRGTTYRHVFQRHPVDGLSPITNNRAACQDGSNVGFLRNTNERFTVNWVEHAQDNCINRILLQLSSKLVFGGV